MENIKPIKPQLHQSHLSMLYHCGIKFERIVLKGDKEPPPTHLIVGEATHRAIAKNLTNKIERGTLLSKEVMQDMAHDEFIKTWESNPVVLNDEEVSQGFGKTKDNAQDMTIALTTEHHYMIAPRIFPKAVERKWVLEAVDYPFDIAGTIDVDEELDFDFKAGVFLPKKITRIRDTKTRKTNLGQKEVDSSEQYTLYAMAKFYIDGVMPDKVIQDNLVKPTKTRPAYAISYESTRTKEDFAVMHRRFEQACRIIEKGAFTPASTSDWWCSKDFCGFAANGTCHYFNSKRTTYYPKTETRKEQDHGKITGSNAVERLTGLISHN